MIRIDRPLSPIRRKTVAELQLILAIVACLSIMSCVPRTAARWNRVGLEQFHHEQYEKAYTSFTEAIALAPDQALPYYNRANVCMYLRRLKDARADFTRAIELDPKYVDAYLRRGDVLFEQNHFDAARADWSTAIGISPDKSDAYYRRGNALTRLERYDEAALDFDRAVTLSPNDPVVFTSRGQFYFETGRYDKAIEDFTSAAALDSKSEEPFVLRAMVYEYGLFRFNEALSDYDRAVDIDPDDPYVLNRRGNLLRKLGRTKEALADFSSICDMGYPFGCWQYEWLSGEK